MSKLTLRPYQSQGVAFLATIKRAMLADAPGLGKTLQASSAAIKPVLITAPTYLVEQWANFLAEQYPEDRISLAVGSRAKRTKALDTPADWFIINHQMLRTYDVPKVTTFIVDESHHFKSHRAEMSQDALTVALQVPRVHLLTATPVVREPDDLYMQLRLLDPRRFKSYDQFVDAFCNSYWGPFGRQISGLKKGTNFAEIIKLYVLGRSYEEVKLQLPTLIEQKLTITPDAALLSRYRRAKLQYRLDNRIINSPLELLRELRRLTVCKQKLDVIQALVEDTPGCSVIFCWFRETAAALAQLLNAPMITGEMQPGERRTVALEKHKVIVATIASLSEGIDLSFAKTVIFAEEDYTPGRMFQAISRVHRWTTDLDPVRVFYVLMRQTVDEVIHHCVDRRISSAQMVLALALQESYDG